MNLQILFGSGSVGTGFGPFMPQVGGVPFENLLQMFAPPGGPSPPITGYPPGWTREPVEGDAKTEPIAQSQSLDLIQGQAEVSEKGFANELMLLPIDGEETPGETDPERERRAIEESLGVEQAPLAWHPFVRPFAPLSVQSVRTPILLGLPAAPAKGLEAVAPPVTPVDAANQYGLRPEAWTASRQPKGEPPLLYQGFVPFPPDGSLRFALPDTSPTMKVQSMDGQELVAETREMPEVPLPSPLPRSTPTGVIEVRSNWLKPEEPVAIRNPWVDADPITGTLAVQVERLAPELEVQMEVRNVRVQQEIATANNPLLSALSSKDVSVPTVPSPMLLSNAQALQQAEEVEDLGTAIDSKADEGNVRSFSDSQAVASDRDDGSREPMLSAPSTRIQAPRQEASLEPQVRDAVLRQVADRVETMVNARVREGVVVHLEPRDLGTVTLVVRAQGATIDAQVFASSEAVRTALEGARAQLGVQLEQRGMHLTGFGVSSSTDAAGFQMSGQNPGLRQPNLPETGPPMTRDELASGAEKSGPRPVAAIGRWSRLDLAI